ncbi:hemerythrin family protein [Clostridium sp. MSJ-8]|uniref:bacteriohemerythrin n=1 Tax=Clostridium sp. MSJ-8 TaxID=2841510 RepID=UPI001C0F2CC1|nr:hemerythrin family protein [Clostridium sp. MSJ-8]MBU5487087.1 hemerythrin family protein [Clostridium sp. MSJ-8]
MYEMKDAYKTNIDIVDEQHKHLFEITDKTYELLTNDLLVDKYDRIMELLDELKEYTQLHFATEEKYMKEINYAGLKEQQIAHEQFIKKLDDYNLNTIDDNQDASIRDLLEFLNSWLVNHIINMDKKIGEA